MLNDIAIMTFKSIIVVYRVTTCKTPACINFYSILQSFKISQKSSSSKILCSRITLMPTDYSAWNLGFGYISVISAEWLFIVFFAFTGCLHHTCDTYFLQANAIVSCWIQNLKTKYQSNQFIMLFSKGLHYAIDKVYLVDDTTEPEGR